MVSVDGGDDDGKDDDQEDNENDQSNNHLHLHVLPPHLLSQTSGALPELQSTLLQIFYARKRIS